MPTFGLPLVCPKCSPKHYFGVLKGENHPTNSVKVVKADVCPNCRTMLVVPASREGEARKTA